MLRELKRQVRGRILYRNKNFKNTLKPTCNVKYWEGRAMIVRTIIAVTSSLDILDDIWPNDMRPLISEKAVLDIEYQINDCVS